MFGPFGAALLTDWGLACEFGPPTGSGLRRADTVKQPCGTPCYLPPGLAESRRPDLGPATDVSLLGIFSTDRPRDRARY